MGRPRRWIALGIGVAVAASAAWYRLADPPSGQVRVPILVTSTGPMSVWPESPFDPPDALRRAQERVDGGRDLWRTRADDVVVRFARNVLGWDRVEVDRIPGGAVHGEVHSLTPVCPDADCVFAGSSPIDVAVDRLGRQGGGGVWSVVAVHSDRLQLPVAAGDTVVAGDALAFGLDLGRGRHAAVGLRSVQRLGGARPLDCGEQFAGDVAVTAAGDTVIVPDPLFDDEACAGLGAVGYVFAYATPRLTVQIGDPLLEPAAIADLSIVPARFSMAPGAATASPDA